MADLEGLTTAIEAGDRTAAARATQQAIDEGCNPQAILDAMTAAMNAVGGRFQRNEIFVPEMLIAARAMKEATKLLEPLLVAADIRPEATAVIGTVKGDLHDIGKNLVGMMWKGANIEVIDLGTNVPPERYVEAAKTHNARIIGIVRAVRDAGMGDVRIILGGAPVTAEFAREIGADGYAPDAGSAVEVAKAALAR
jgi:5-methyltetrahydrofolate--homocysteine methyltransferase